ncbi:MAG: hypothetical protein E6H71_07085 [Betaproteobacteria bacterium]|nr:MAG: hypothetical protein E6H71_07085 [Betaproteobacteria bacterium]
MFPISDAEIAAVVTELRRRQRFLASLGIAYVVTIVPEKYTIYPEHLPVWVAKGDAPPPLERLMVAISADGNVRFVDLRAPLAAAKVRERVYYTTDSHWNMLGAAVGYNAMAIPLIPLLSENFSRIVYVSARRLDPGLILRERPDIVIEEIVERAMLEVATAPMT